LGLNLGEGSVRCPEERSVAKILVADDNSNIQKMVGLALKDQGIDVVAVGNGEAAVRKIADIHPDLVLADVFMPVRNGYEVCAGARGCVAWIRGARGKAARTAGATGSGNVDAKRQSGGTGGAEDCRGRAGT